MYKINQLQFWFGIRIPGTASLLLFLSLIPYPSSTPALQFPFFLLKAKVLSNITISSSYCWLFQGFCKTVTSFPMLGLTDDKPHPALADGTPEITWVSEDSSPKKSAVTQTLPSPRHIH